MKPIDHMPRFAVLLAAYNGMKFISIQIDSILAQSNVSVHIYISVDPSSDGTEAYLSEKYQSDFRVTLLPPAGPFGGAGPNFYRLIRTVDIAKYDYLSFSDQDDVWMVNKLWRAHSVLNDGSFQAYSSSFRAFWENGKSVVVNKAYPQKRWDYFFESAGPGCTYVLSRLLALNFKKFIELANPNYLSGIEFHDWLVYAYSRHNNFNWFIDDWISLNYRQHQQNQIGVNSGWIPFWLRVKKILNGYGVSQSLLISNLIAANSMNIVQRGMLDGRLGYVWLSFQCCECRRRKIDRVMFFISCLFLAIIHPLNSVRNK